MSATDTLDNATAVPTRKRALDQLTFFSSHKECYELGRHAKTPQGREMCRTGQGFSGVQQSKPNPVTTIKSKISHVVHVAIGGTATLCDVKLSAPILVQSDDYPVTCKKCLKSQSA